MGAISIIGYGSPQAKESPPLSQWGQLYNLLQNATGARIVLNAYGDVCGFAANGNLFTPQTIATFVAQGNIYVDWCGTPMYYQMASDGSLSTVGTAGFTAFADALRYNWLASSTWESPALGDLTSLTAGARLPAFNGVYLWRTTVNGVPMYQNDTALIFGLHHPGIGWYFWAEPAIPLYEDIAAYFAVTPGAYATFIRACLSGEIAPQAAYSASGGGSSGSGGSGSGGSGGSGSGGGSGGSGGGSHPTTQGPSPWVYVGAGAGVLGLGGLAYYLYGRQ